MEISGVHSCDHKMNAWKMDKQFLKNITHLKIVTVFIPSRLSQRILFHIGLEIFGVLISFFLVVFTMLVRWDEGGRDKNVTFGFYFFFFLLTHLIIYQFQSQSKKDSLSVKDSLLPHFRSHCIFFIFLFLLVNTTIYLFN